VRSSLPSGREARVLFGFHDGMLIALHALIKKSQKTPADALLSGKTPRRVFI
jgi:phage-related protein